MVDAITAEVQGKCQGKKRRFLVEKQLQLQMIKKGNDYKLRMLSCKRNSKKQKKGTNKQQKVATSPLRSRDRRVAHSFEI